MKPLLIATAVTAFCATAAVADGFAPRDQLQSINGTYKSEAPEPWYGSYGTREFVFADGRWQLTFTHALDPAMTMRTFQFRTGGKYEIREPSPEVAGAYHGIFHEEWKHVTLLTENPEIISAMGMAECDLTFNLETDISQTGCALWKPVAECGEDHDLFAMDTSGVYFGVRPPDNDTCSADKLPSVLLPVVPAFAVIQ